MRFVPILLLLVTALPAQPRLITLRECLDTARIRKPELRSAEYDIEIARSRTRGEQGTLGPRITIGYDLDYHAIIPAQVLPTGQFLPVPTDEQRAVRFGTPWQQAAGLTAYQPLLDYLTRSRIAERELDIKLRELDLQAREETLSGEIIRSYARLRTLAAALAKSAADTAGTWTNVELVRARVEEGRELRSELNEALVNHNRARTSFLEVEAEARREKVRLAWLSGIPAAARDDAEFEFGPLADEILEPLAQRFLPDSTAAFRSYLWQEEKLGQQILTTRRQRFPVLGLQGFLGANQFADTFTPFRANTWYGSSYVGLNLSFPLLPGEDLKNGIRQSELAREQVRSIRQEARDRLENEDRMAADELRQLRAQEVITRSSVELLEENVLLMRDRYAQGQVPARRLNETEIDWQREQAVLLELESKRTLRLIDRIIAGGNLPEFVRNLR